MINYYTARVYGLESIDAEINRLNIDEAYFTEEDHPFTMKSNFSTLGRSIEIESGRGWKISFVHDTIRDLLGSNPGVLHDEFNLSDYPVDILSFDNIFVGTDNSQGMIFKGERSGLMHKFILDVGLGYKYLENFRGGVQYYVVETRDFIASISFILKNESGSLSFINGQSITFPLSMKKF